MKISKITLAVAAALFSSAAMADSWTVTQTVTPGASATITQSATDSSVQSLNTINAVAATLVGNSSQTVTTAETLSFDQTGTGATNSIQASNYANAATLGVDGTTAFTQTHAGAGAVSLSQAGEGTGNTQAINAAYAATNMINLEQVVDAPTTVNLLQTDAAGNDSLQAANLADTSATSAANAIDQSLDTANLNLDQGVSTGLAFALQAGNAVITGGNNGGTATQGAAHSASLDMDQVGTASSHQAINYLGVAIADPG